MHFYGFFQAEVNFFNLLRRDEAITCENYRQYKRDPVLREWKFSYVIAGYNSWRVYKMGQNWCNHHRTCRGSYQKMLSKINNYFTLAIKVFENVPVQEFKGIFQILWAWLQKHRIEWNSFVETLSDAQLFLQHTFR